MQSQAWAAFQVAQGKRTFFARGAGWSWLAVLERGRFGNRLYTPYGPTARSASALQKALEALQDCAAAHKASYLRCEPHQKAETLKQLGFTAAHRNIQPRFTLVKNLSRPDDALLAEMTSTNRNLYRTAGNKGLSFRESTTPADIAILLEMLHEVAAKNQIEIHSDDYFRAMAEALFPHNAGRLFIAEFEGQPVAASLVLDSPTTRYYAHAASRFEARKLHPGTPLLAHMIFDAKHRGQTSFDFYGIAPLEASSSHPWSGFTRFKQSFGGEVVDLGGTWELPIKKLQHLAYRVLARLG